MGHHQVRALLGVSPPTYVLKPYIGEVQGALSLLFGSEFFIGQV